MRLAARQADDQSISLFAAGKKRGQAGSAAWFGRSCLFFFFTLSLSAFAFSEEEVVRAGHFPTVTHAPALVGRSQGYFEKALGGDTAIEWNVFNAGPAAIEAVFAGKIDILYVGPNPAVNGYVRSGGKALRIAAGAASGGSALVVRDDTEIHHFEELRGKRIVTPQIGNSQDVALRHLMTQRGMKAKSQGGDIEIFHMGGGAQIAALSRRNVDAVWTVEPFVSRMIREANGKILIDEKKLWPNGVYATAVLAVRKNFLDEHPALVRKWVEAHVELIEWINDHLEEAKQAFNQELKRETGASLERYYLDRCFERVRFTAEPMEFSVRESAARAFEIGYLGKEKPDLSQLYDLSFLKKG